MHKVVVVDDEYMIKQTLKKLIDGSELPFRVVGEAEDGLEALAAIERLKPDLVVTDIRMPAMGGLELVEEARRRNSQLAFIIISGHDDFAYAQQALRYGVADYLLKPLKPAQLEETLKRVWDRFQADERADTQRSEWLLFCSGSTQPLVKHVWLLNETEALKELKDIHREMTQRIAGPELRRQALRDLMAFVEGEIDRQLGPSKRLETERPPALPDDPEELYDVAESRILQLLEEIRLTRNWGNYGQTRRASEYIEEHFTEEGLSLQEVAEVTGMSPSYFSRSFKEEFGISFIHYLTKLRMEKAMALLADPDNKTYEIAYAVGYKDYPHFTKVFKKYWGLSPTEAKKRL